MQLLLNLLIKCNEIIAAPFKDVRAPTPIVEDPNEDRSVTPISLGGPDGSTTASDSASADSHQLKPSSPTAEETKSSVLPAATSSSTPDPEKSAEISVSRAATPSDVPISTVSRPTTPLAKSSDDSPSKQASDAKDSLKSIKSIKKVTLVPPDQPTARPITPTGDKGKSKTTGKTVTGWL